MVAMLAWLQHMPWFLLVLGALTAPVIILLGINQYAIFRERHKKGVTKLSDKELEDTVREWVNISAWSVQWQESTSDTIFQYQIKHNDDVPIHIEMQTKDRSVILLATDVKMASQKTVLSASEWERLAGQLSIDMARLGIQFGFVGPTNPWDTIRLIEPVMLDDSITGFYFRSRVMFVVRAVILTRELWKEALRVSEQSTHSKGASQS